MVIVYFLPDVARSADVAGLIARHGLKMKQSCVCSVEFDGGDVDAELVSLLEGKRVPFDRVHRQDRNVEVVECVRRLGAGLVRSFSTSFVIGACRPSRVGAVGVFLD